MAWLKKIKDWIGFEVPSFEITKEREEEIIDKTISVLNKWGMVLPASLMLYGFEPMSSIVSQTMLLPWAPFLEFLGVKGYEYTAFLMKKENVRAINKRLSELRAQREKGGFWG
jgi:hypothetical protein